MSAGRRKAEQDFADQLYTGSCVQRRSENGGEESRPGAFPLGTSCFAQVFASGLGGGTEDPVPKLEASRKMEVCSRAAGD